MGLDNRIDALKTRHEELELALEMENTRTFPDDQEIHSLKKAKLRIKDELNSLTRH